MICFNERGWVMGWDGSRVLTRSNGRERPKGLSKKRVSALRKGSGEK